MLILSIFIPLIGTVLGSAMVFFLKKNLSRRIERILLGFASGVMIAASVWSLLIPALEYDDSKFGFVLPALGFLLGIGFLLALDMIIPHLHVDSSEPEGRKSKAKKTTMLVLAVTLHNIPEGMAVGVTIAGAMAGNGLITAAGALVLAIGIAIQNFPEGAIISMPLYSEGVKKPKSFLYGALSGIVEPIATILTILFSSLVLPILPVLLAFAAGAMIYVVVDELIPSSNENEHSHLTTIALALGFVLMMILDVALG